MALEITANDTLLLLQGWLGDHVALKALFFSPDLRCCATVYGFLHTSVDGNLFIHPASGPDISSEVSALVFRLDEVQRYEFAAADVVENARGLTPGQLARVHGDTMLTLLFQNGTRLSISNLPGRDA